MSNRSGLKILIVCTFGAGSSALLKMNIDKVIAALNVTGVTTEVCDSGSAMSNTCDGIITTISHKETVKNHPTARAFGAVRGTFDTVSIEEEVRRVLKELGLDI